MFPVFGLSNIIIQIPNLLDSIVEPVILGFLRIDL